MVKKLKEDENQVYVTKIQNRGRTFKYSEEEQKDITSHMESDRKLTARGVARNFNILSLILYFTNLIIIIANIKGFGYFFLSKI